MDISKLFIRTLDDLHRSINSFDEYEVLRASHLIRQLLLDGASSLVEQVNRTHRLKIEYHVTETSIYDGPGTPTYWCALESIEPSKGPPKARRISVRRDEFLRTPVIICKGECQSIHDIIDYLAHIAGGVHVTQPRTTNEQMLAALMHQYSFAGLSALAITLRSIGRVILTALRDLKSRVLALERFDDAPGISIHTNLALFPMPGGRENYIFDFGNDENRDRVSVYLDSRGELLVRLYSSSGRVSFVGAGGPGCGYTYGVPMYLTCEIAKNGNELLVCLEAISWDINHVFAGSHMPNLEPFCYVLGSDITGKAHTNIAFYEQCIYKNKLNSSKADQVKNYFQNKLHKGYTNYAEFKGNQFLYSSNHPRFSHKSNSTDTV